VTDETDVTTGPTGADQPLTAYLATLGTADRDALERVRGIVTRAVPGTTEGRSYGLAALLLDGRPLLGFRAAGDHLSVFPFSPAVVAAVADRLPGYKLSKGTIRFTARTPLPEAVVVEIARLRGTEIRLPEA
jgi:uncharacterized protein YdhG (YjbR/CyaY superfamily)